MAREKTNQTYTALTKASEIMSRPVHSVNLGSTLREVSKLFIEKNIGAAAVVDKYGIPIGVITKTDLARHELEGVPAGTREKKSRNKKIPRGFHAELEEETAERWMTPFISGVHPNTVLEEVAKKMEKNKLHHIFVTDKETGFIEGIITSYDLMRVLHVILSQESRRLTRSVKIA